MLPENGTAETLQQVGRKSSSYRKSSQTEVVPLSLHLLVCGLALTSIAILLIVDASGEFSWRLTGWFAFQVCSLGLAVFYMRSLSVKWKTPPSVSPVLLLLACSALIYETCSRLGWGVGRPFELLTMYCLSHVIWGLAAVSVWKRYQALAVVMSLFLAMFGTTSHYQLGTHLLAMAFACGALFWLIGSHWENLRQRLVSSKTTSTRRSQFAVAGMFLLVTLVFVTASDLKALRALSGFVPSSGGNGGSDPYARDGVGDGDALVAGSENVQSFGPIEDAPFMQDDKPSLYDLFDDTYEEELTLPTKSDRAIALPPEMVSRIDRHIHNQTQKANREFSTLRKQSDAEAHTVKDIHSNALFYVAGRTPLHLRMQVYDLFDGVTWYPVEKPDYQIPLSMVEVGDDHWLSLPNRQKNWDVFGAAETHAIKVVHLDTNVIPAPAHLHGIQIANVDRADMFQWHTPSTISMCRKELPELVPIHLASCCVHSERLGELPFMGGEAVARHVPEELQPILDEFTQEWESLSVDRHKVIEVVTARFQQEFKLSGSDDFVDAPVATFINDLNNAEGTGRISQEMQDQEDRILTGVASIERTLLERKQGFDYELATAHALSLRTLGFATRVVSGFYVDPDKYDAKSRHTPVYTEDVHFWVEVYAGGGIWITSDPSPGYVVLSPPLTWWQQIRHAFYQSWLWVIAHRIQLSVGLFLASVVVWFRYRLLDLFQTWRWRLRSDSQRTHAEAYRIVERRLSWNGLKRQQSQTPRNFLLHSDEIQTGLSEIPWETFLQQLEEESFSPTSMNVREDTHRNVVSIANFSACARAVRQCNSNKQVDQ